MQDAVIVKGKKKIQFSSYWFALTACRRAKAIEAEVLLCKKTLQSAGADEKREKKMNFFRNTIGKTFHRLQANLRTQYRESEELQLEDVFDRIQAQTVWRMLASMYMYNFVLDLNQHCLTLVEVCTRQCRFNFEFQSNRMDKKRGSPFQYMDTDWVCLRSGVRLHGHGA